MIRIKKSLSKVATFSKPVKINPSLHLVYKVACNKTLQNLARKKIALSTFYFINDSMILLFEHKLLQTNNCFNL
jgi:hypothetical protein